MSTSLPSLPRPRLVNLSMMLALFSALAGAASLFMVMPKMMENLGEQGLPVDELGSGILYGGAIGGVVMVAIFCFFIARGSNVARWVWALFAAYGAVSAPGSIATALNISTLFAGVGIVLQLLSIASTVLLFMPESGAWFKAVKLARTLS